MLDPLNALIKDWNRKEERDRRRKKKQQPKKHAGLNRIIPKQLLESINLVPLQKVVFVRGVAGITAVSWRQRDGVWELSVHIRPRWYQGI